nr:MAG TPA: hypothetical protein [Caudoviricetes sp.]
MHSTCRTSCGCFLVYMLAIYILHNAAHHFCPNL